MSYPLDNALYEWEEGYRRLERLSDRPALYRHYLRAVDALRDELRRRIGPTFSAEELANLYAQGTDWCLRITAELAPDDVAEWDPQVLADAAFYLHLRGAHDWAGGRRVAVE